MSRLVLVSIVEELTRYRIPRSAEIVRLVPRAPLNVATEARLLVLRDRLAGEHGVKCGAQIASRHRHVAPRSRAVELAAVDERALRVEEEEVRRASRVVGLRHRL